MFKKKKVKKFGLEKFEVSKLNNKSKIFGGDEPEGPDTENTGNSTTRPKSVIEEEK